MIENQFERGFEQTLKFGAEYDAHYALCARVDIDRVALENCFEPSATMNKDRVEDRIRRTLDHSHPMF